MCQFNCFRRIVSRKWRCYFHDSNVIIVGINAVVFVRDNLSYVVDDTTFVENGRSATYTYIVKRIFATIMQYRFLKLAKIKRKYAFLKFILCGKNSLQSYTVSCCYTPVLVNYISTTHMLAIPHQRQLFCLDTIILLGISRKLKSRKSLIRYFTHFN